MVILISRKHFKCINPGTYSYKNLEGLRFEKCDKCPNKCWAWKEYARP